MVKFPKYLLFFVDKLNEKELLEHPVKKFEQQIDITEYAAPEALEHGEKLEYSLIAFVAHPQNTDPTHGMYQAIVKRTIDQKEEWVKFHYGEWKIIKDKKAMAHPA